MKINRNYIQGERERKTDKEREQDREKQMVREEKF